MKDKTVGVSIHIFGVLAVVAVLWAIQLVLPDFYMVGNVVAIPSGSQCEGTVTDVRRSGIFGRDGKLVITYGTIKAVDGSAVPLIVGDKAKEQYKQMKIAAGASVAGAVILGPVGLVGGLFVKGSEVNIPAGTTMFTEVKTDTDVMIQVVVQVVMQVNK